MAKSIWRDAPEISLDENILRPASNPFSPEGGLREIKGNLGRAIAKVSAVKPEHQIVEAPCVVFDDQDDFLAAFKAKQLPEGDFICVVRFQGPKANGMPELHSPDAVACRPFSMPGARWRWCRTGACRGHRERCRPLST